MIKGVSSYGTPFAETEALLAVSVCDSDTARDLIRGMTRTERRSLADALEGLDELIAEVDKEGGPTHA